MTKLITMFCFMATVIGMASWSFAQSQVSAVTLETIKADLATVQCKNDDRLESVRKIFLSKGAKPEDIKVEKIKNIENVVVTKTGKSPETIVLGAHFDKTPDGCGAIDNWTGIVILANLYATLSSAPTEKTIVFAAFGKEEVGLVGSRAMAGSIKKEDRQQYCAMVNMDSFGFTYPQVLSNASTPKMTKFAKDLALELKMPFSEASLSGTADADSSSFVGVGIPGITFHGLSNKWPEFLHSSKDKLEAINPQSVLVGYQFASIVVDRLDPLPCGSFRKS